MSEPSDLSKPLPPALTRAVSSLKWGGTIGLWLQLILGTVSAITLLVAIPGIFREDNAAAEGTGFGLFFAIAGLIALAISIYFSFRFTQLSKSLALSEPEDRPSRARIISLIRFCLIVNLVGMLLTLLGAQAIVGSVLVESLTQSPGLGVGGASARFVLPIDLFVVQSNTNTIAAHFVGIASSLWLLYRITK